MRRGAIVWCVVLLQASCRGGELPPPGERSDADADSALARALSTEFAVAEVSLSRTGKVVGLWLVDSAFARLPDSSRPARATALARWTWHRLAHPAGTTRLWVWASAPGPADRRQAGALYSYWTRDLEAAPGSGEQR